MLLLWSEVPSSFDYFTPLCELLSFDPLDLFLPAFEETFDSLPPAVEVMMEM